MFKRVITKTLSWLRGQDLNLRPSGYEHCYLITQYIGKPSPQRLITPSFQEGNYKNRVRNNIITTTMLLFVVTGCTSMKIHAVNTEINSYHYIPHTEKYLKTPEEFYRDGGGICGDFANAKYHALVKDGIPADQMRFVINIADQQNKIAHVMLQVDNHILDSRTNAILPADKVIGARLTYDQLLEIYGDNNG